MLLVIMGVSLVVGIVCLILEDRLYAEWPGFVGGISLAIFCVSFVVFVIVGACYSSVRVVDKKIAMYQEENERIEERIQVVVNEYMQYESDTFDKIQGEGDPITYVTLFPELKSNTLVAKQIEVYESNNQQIKELQCEKLDHELEAWWLFFGGGE